METQLLREREIFPSKEVLRSTLGNVYDVLEELETLLTQEEFAFTFYWKYNRIRKAWRCQVTHKKKTVFWITIWTGYFKARFFFLERHLEGVVALEIDENSIIVEKDIVDMIPLNFNINNKKQFPDLLKMIKYKQAAK